MTSFAYQGKKTGNHGNDKPFMIKICVIVEFCLYLSKKLDRILPFSTITFHPDKNIEFEKLHGETSA